MAVEYRSTFPLHKKFEKLSFQYESQVSVDSGMSSCPSTPSTPTSPVDVDIKIATKDDVKAMREFLFKFFFKDEPLNKSTNLLAKEDDSTLNELEMFSLKDADNGQCVLALHNGNLIGVAINAILERNWLEKEDGIKIEDPKFKKITALLDYVAKESDPFKKFVDCDKAMTIKIISVDDTYRGKGIAKQLMTKTREMAKASGCGFMTVDCTSHFTALALKKLGFQLHYSLNYSDYKVDGKVVFTPEPPHKAVTVYTQKL